MNTKLIIGVLLVGLLIAAALAQREEGGPFGACCLPGGACANSIDEDACVSMGGFWHEGIGCPLVEPCPTVFGACCFTDGSCMEGLQIHVCEVTLGGVLNGPGMPCSEVSCTPSGACCMTDGSCLFLQVDNCFPPNTYQGHDTLCEDGCFIGACCFVDDTCTQATEDSCVSQGGIWAGLRVSCSQATECECFQTDIDSDAFVGISDFLLVLAQWGPCPPQCVADVDGDGNVGILDFLLVLANWGPCP